MLKLVGAAAVAGTAGFLARSDDAEAVLINVRIENVAAQICAAVLALNTILDGGGTLTCTIGR